MRGVDRPSEAESAFVAIRLVAHEGFVNQSAAAPQFANENIAEAREAVSEQVGCITLGPVSENRTKPISLTERLIFLGKR